MRTMVDAPPLPRRARWLGASVALLVLTAAPPAAHTATLAAVSFGPGDATVIGRHPATGRLAEARWSSSQRRWLGWNDLGGAPTAPGADVAAVGHAGVLHVLSVATDGRLLARSRSRGVWGRAVRLTDFRVAGGPAAVEIRGTVHLLVRRASDARLVHIAWSPERGRATTTATNIRGAAGAGPALVSVDGRRLEAAALTRRKAPRVMLFALDPDRPANPIRGSVRVLSGTAAGSPALAAGTSPRSVRLIARTGDGTVVQRERPVRGVAPATPWRPLSGGPDGVALADSPAALNFRPTTGSVRDLVALLPAVDGRGLLQNAPTSGWVRFALSPPGGESNGSGPDAKPPTAATLTQSVPTPTPAPTPEVPAGPPPPQPSLDGPEAKPAGTIRYFGRTSNLDGWDDWFRPVNTPSAARQHILRNIWRLELFANGNPTYNGALATSWFPGGMVYRQLYTIDDDTAARHPSWVMRDAAGNRLYADDGQNPRTLLAGNIFNAKFREWVISHSAAGGTDQGGLLQTLGAGAFRGLWLDNVNPELLGSGLTTQAGSEVGMLRGGPVYAPRNAPGSVATEGQSTSTCAGQAGPNGSGLPITDACWSQGMVGLLRQLRAAMPPSKELLVNVPWYRTQRDPSTYLFLEEPTSAFTVVPELPSNVDPPLAGGLWTDHGKAVADAATYVNIEGAFWANAFASGPGYGGLPGAGRSDDGYSVDMMFRYIDALHRRGKGFVADNWVSRTTGPDVLPAPESPADNALLRVQEFNLAGYLLTTDGRDGIGDFNPRSDTLWPTISGTGGSTLYGMDVGTATTRPAGSLDPRTNADDPGPGPTGRGVAAFASPPAGRHRLWVRAFVREDGKRVFALLAEPSQAKSTAVDDGPFTAGATLTYAPPIGAGQCTNMTRASQPTYARWDTSTKTARLGPASALFLLCDPAS